VVNQNTTNMDYDDLFLACKNGDTFTVEEYLDREISIRSGKGKSKFFETPITEVRDDNGNTPLILAVWFGRIKVVKILLDHGANIEGRNDTMDTALIWASCYKYFDIIKMLLEYGADVDSKGRHGETSLFFSVGIKKNNDEIVKLLLDYNADIELRSYNGCTPLMEAARHGNVNIIKILLERNADTEAKNIDNKTFIHYLKGEKLKKVTQIMEDIRDNEVGIKPPKF